MITKATFTAGDLYQLFGNDSKIEVERVFDALLYGISILNFNVQEFQPSSLDGNFGGVQNFAFPDTSNAKGELPKYLNQQHDDLEMQEIENALADVKRQKKVLAGIPWYNVSDRIANWWELKTLENKEFPIQDVFGYLECRVTGMTKDELYASFKKFAEHYHERFLW